MGGGHTGPMPEWQRKVLRDNRDDLTHDLDVNDVINHMIQENILTRHMQENVMSKPTPIEKTEAFLDLLPRRGEKAFWTFLNALEETYEHLYLKMKPAIDREIQRVGHESEIYEDLVFTPPEYTEPCILGPPSQFDHPQSYVTPIVGRQGDHGSRTKEVNPTLEITTDVMGDVVEEYSKQGKH